MRILLSVFRGSEPLPFPEDTIEVRQIIISALITYFGNGVACVGQPAGSLGYTDVVQIVDKCFSCPFIQETSK